MEEAILNSISPEHLRYLEQQLDIGLWLWVLGTNRLWWSAGLFRILGLAPQTTSPSFELYRSVVHPEDQLDFTDREAIATTGKLAHRRFRIIRPAGEMRWVESHGQLLFDSEGHATQMIGFARDITNFKAAIDNSASHSSAMRALRQLTGSSIWKVAKSGAFVDDSAWWQMIDGGAANGRLGARTEEIHPDDLPVVQSAWAKAGEEIGIYRGTYRTRQDDGSYREVSSVAVPMRNEDGDHMGWMGVSMAADLPAPVRYLQADEVPPELFRAARGYLDLAGEAFASKVGVSYSTVRRLESTDSSKVGVAARQQVVDFLAHHGLKFTADSFGTAQLLIAERRPQLRDKPK